MGTVIGIALILLFLFGTAVAGWFLGTALTILFGLATIAPACLLIGSLREKDWWGALKWGIILVIEIKIISMIW